MHQRPNRLSQEGDRVIVRIFIVDDAPFIRKAIRRVLKSDPGVEVVGEAAGGLEALEKIPGCRPDLVTLDIDMPDLNGLSTLRRLMAMDSSLRVIMLSALTGEGAQATLEALSIGAVDFIDKTRLNLMDFAQLTGELLNKIKVWGRTSPAAGSGEFADPTRVQSLPVIDGESFDVCVIGASTGGPAAIERIARSWPRSFDVPMVVVQHMPEGFTRPFAERLNRLSHLDVLEAVNGAELEPGRVLIAPAGQHLRLVRGARVRLSEEPSNTNHRPSIDVTMYSAATATERGRVAGVLLTGMGTDGAEGMYAIRENDGLTIAQSEGSCVVPGMPRAASLRGAVEVCLTLEDIVELFSGTPAGQTV